MVGAVSRPCSPWDLLQLSSKSTRVHTRGRRLAASLMTGTVAVVVVVVAAADHQRLRSLHWGFGAQLHHLLDYFPGLTPRLARGLG